MLPYLNRENDRENNRDTNMFEEALKKGEEKAKGKFLMNRTAFKSKIGLLLLKLWGCC